MKVDLVHIYIEYDLKNGKLHVIFKCKWDIWKNENVKKGNNTLLKNLWIKKEITMEKKIRLNDN